MTTIVATVIVLGVLIFVHEFGHFLLAKLLGVRVEIFSLGFPPRLLHKQIGDTDYRLSVVPLGGYVKLLGENPNDEVPEELQTLLFHAPSLVAPLPHCPGGTDLQPAFCRVRLLGRSLPFPASLTSPPKSATSSKILLRPGPACRKATWCNR